MRQAQQRSLQSAPPAATVTQVVAGAVGNTLEWYDFAAYGYFALIFGRNFYPETMPWRRLPQRSGHLLPRS
jgi:hypothetical protein